MGPAVIHRPLATNWEDAVTGSRIDGEAAGTHEALDRLRLGTGIAMSERDQIISQFAPLGARLRSVEPDSIDMELSVKERDGADQRVTLELWMAGRDRLVSTSSRSDVTSALQEVRDDMVRLLNDSITRGERYAT
jgi:hypothetical protein